MCVCASDDTADCCEVSTRLYSPILALFDGKMDRDARPIRDLSKASTSECVPGSVAVAVVVAVFS